MKPFYHDHPLRETPPGALSCDELRFWIRWLLKTPGSPWTPVALGLAFGCGGSTPGTVLKAKINPKTSVWIYPSEQLRFSRQLPKVLAGELEPVNVGWSPNGKGFTAVRVADQPKPLKLPIRWRYDLKRGKLERHPFRLVAYRDALPSFKSVMGTERWNGRWND